MPVPKAAVHEDDFPAGGEHEVGLAWQSRLMEAETIAQAMNE
jgi:hypothetical protein